MIELDSIMKTYGEGGTRTEVLKGISFRIESGEFVAIMGASGTGKSTLMNILGALDKPSSGKYNFENAEVAAMNDDELSKLRNAKIGFVFQQFHLMERTSALQNVMLPLIYANEYPPDAAEHARKALTAVGLEDRLNYSPGELSGGEQQRVAIARALITNPAVILADEPTGNLDSKSSLEILAIFQRLHSEGRTIVAITHDEKVAKHANRIVTLADGFVMDDKPVHEPSDAAKELQALSGKEEVK